MSVLNILVVEDDPVTALALSSLLQKEGYQVIGTVDNGPAALTLFRDQPVDLVLMDVNIRGDQDGIQTASRLLALRPVPLIYLTSRTDRDTLERAKTTFPAAYLVKPFRREGVRAAIELAIQNFTRPKNAPVRSEPVEPDGAAANRETILQIDNHIFIRQNYQFLKVRLADILFIEAADNYIVLQTNSQKFALRMPLSSALERIHYDKLVRVHRSYVVNVGNMDSFTDTEINMGKHQIPIGKNYKSEFLKYFHYL
jgi:DNA-binding LytR/AlgR family response regulator